MAIRTRIIYNPETNATIPEEVLKDIKLKHVVTLRGTLETMAWGKIIHQHKRYARLKVKKGKLVFKFRGEYRPVIAERVDLVNEDGTVEPLRSIFYREA